MNASAQASRGLVAENLVRDYGQGPVLDGLSFALAGGETLSVIGPSGCGKSTLLYLLAGLDVPQSGNVRLIGPPSENGNAPRRPRAAFILQDYGLFPWKTVRENLSLPLEIAGPPPRERNAAIAAMLAELALEGLEDRYPDQISGGQRQRVAIGRALITNPDILLMDEPFSSLDSITREHLQNLVLSLWQRRHMTCVLVTHNVAEATFLGKHVMVLRGRPAQKALWLENPCFNKPDARTDEEALTVTQRIYEALREDGEEAGCAC